MFNQPWGAAHFQQPYLANVAYPQVLVSRAVYDPAKKALVATLRPASEGATLQATPLSTRFSVGNLAADAAFSIRINGVEAGRLAAGVVTARPGDVSLSYREGVLWVETPLHGATDLVVQQGS